MRQSRSIPLLITRRAFTAALSLTGLSLLAGFSPLRLIADAMAQGAADVAKPISLPDMALGPANALVTITEYASMTCPHCAAFNARHFRRSSRNNRLLAKLASIFPNHALLANFVLVDVAEGAPICLSKACTTSAFLSKIWTAQKRSTSEFLASPPVTKSQTGFSLGIIFRFT